MPEETESQWLGRLMFDEICEIRPDVSLRLETCEITPDGTGEAFKWYSASVFTGGEWFIVAMREHADEACAALVEYLGITQDEIDANAEKRGEE